MLILNEFEFIDLEICFAEDSDVTFYTTFSAFFIVSFVENIFFPSPGVSFIDDLIS